MGIDPNVTNRAGPGAVDFFLKCKDIEGESEDPTHKGEIELESWNWEIASPRDSATGQKTGRYRLGNLKVRTGTTKASVLLMTALKDNVEIKEVLLTCRKTGTGKQGSLKDEYLKVKLTNAHVASIEMSAGEGDAAPQEEIEFGYQTVEFEYRPRNKDGSLGASVMSQMSTQLG
jgi:type VI secretion system secreted protein Hcp